ncbi:MAG: histidinol-phosphate transaminase [Chitinophagales bacterium]
MNTIQHLIRPNIQKMTAYSSARSEFKGKANVFLDANENPFDTGLNRYPDPLQWKVKSEISKLKNIVIQSIFLGNGSDEVIDLLIRIFCEPRKDAIMVLPPTYGMYEVSAAISDVEVQRVLLTADYQLDVKAILEAVKDNTKLLFVCSPNNPTGNCFTLEAIEALLEGFEGIVVVDEAYIDFASEASCVYLLKKYVNLVVMQTFSKAWGLAGIRLGMAFASEEIIDVLNKVKPPYNVNRLTQNAALRAMQNVDRYRKERNAILHERNVLTRALQQFSFVEKVHASDANFLLVKVKAAQELYDYLTSKGIIVRNRSKVVLCEGCLRITVGTETENLEVLAALAGYVGKEL